MSQIIRYGSGGGGGGTSIELLQGDTGPAVGPNGGGTVFILGGLNIETVGDAGTFSITVGETQSRLLNNYTAVNASPYVVVADDYYLSVDSSGIPITIELPDAPTQYRILIIKDAAGDANVNNITVTTVGGVVLIDGATTFVMNTSYEAINIVFNGTSYEVY